MTLTQWLVRALMRTDRQRDDGQQRDRDTADRKDSDQSISKTTSNLARIFAVECVCVACTLPEMSVKDAVSSRGQGVFRIG